MAQKTQVNSATLILGPTGTGKSTLAYTLAVYLWQTYRKVLYYYNCDGGGFPAKVQEGIAIGIIKGFRMRTRDPGDLGLAFETCYRSAQGYWPRRITPGACEVQPGVEMVAPIAKRLLQSCPNGHPIKTVLLQSQLTPQKCPSCGVMVTTQTMQVQETLVHAKGFEDRGGVFFDGLTSMLSWEMMELSQRAGRLELKGEEGAIGGKIISGQMKFGGSNRSHYGFTQTRGEELAHLALGIPNLLIPPVFTALSMETSDAGNLTVVGPIISGSAKTDVAGQWFGNCIETAKRPATNGAGEEFCLYLSEFTDGEGRRHLLKHRGAPGTMPDVLVDPANGAAPLTEFNLGKFFSLLDDALSAGIESAKLQFPDAPGLPDGEVEFGDGGGAQAAAPAVQGTETPAPAGVTGQVAPLATPPQTRRAPTRAPRAPQVSKPAVAPAPVESEPALPLEAVEEAPAVVAEPEPVPEVAEVAAAPVEAPVPAQPVPTPVRPVMVAAPPPGRRPTPAGAPAAIAGPAMKPAAAAPRPPAPRASTAKPPAARPAPKA